MEENKSKGGLRRIAEPPPDPCRHPEHDFPGMIVLEPGVWEHECPQCGRKQVRNITRPTM